MKTDALFADERDMLVVPVRKDGFEKVFLGERSWYPIRISEKMVEKIAEGKLEKFFKDSCLMNQAYVRDPNITISDLLNNLIAKIGENISIKRFVRFQIGES